MQVLGFSSAARPRNPLRRLPMALLGLLGVLVWSCSPSSAGVLLARQALVPKASAVRQRTVPAAMASAPGADSEGDGDTKPRNPRHSDVSKAGSTSARIGV